MSKWEVIETLRKSSFPRTAMDLEKLGIVKSGQKLRDLCLKHKILDRIIIKSRKGKTCFAYLIKKGISPETLETYEPYIIK